MTMDRKKVQIPPFSSIFEGDRSVIVCDVCEGYPRCVEVCQKQAIQFI